MIILWKGFLFAITNFGTPKGEDKSTVTNEIENATTEP